MSEGEFESLGPKVWGGMGCNGGAINRGDEKVPEIGDYSNLMAERCNRDRSGRDEAATKPIEDKNKMLSD